MVAGASTSRLLEEQIDGFLAIDTAVDLDARPPEGSAAWSFRRHLRARRDGLELSRRELAARLGSCSNSVLSWERDRQLPEIQFWPAVIAFLGYDPLPAPTNIVEHIEAKRRRLGWTYKRVAAHIGVGSHTVLKWKDGRNMRFLRRGAIEGLVALVRG